MTERRLVVITDEPRPIGDTIGALAIVAFVIGTTFGVKELVEWIF